MSIQQTFDFLDTSSPSIEIASLDGPSPAEAPSPCDRNTPSPSCDRNAVLRELRAKVGCITTTRSSDAAAGGAISTGSKAIDGWLPRGGLRHDGITEWVAEADGCGAGTLSMIAAATHLKSPGGSGPLVVVGGQNLFHPPAAVALGIPADRIIWVRPTVHAELVWAIDQSLRCQSVAAVWAVVGANLDDRDARRFQLASETGHTPGLFIRPALVRGHPSFGDVRFHVDNLAKVPGSVPRVSGRVIKVTLDRCRGGAIGQSLWVRIDDRARVHRIPAQPLGVTKDETATVRLASELAHPKTSTRRTDRRRAC